MPDRIGHHRAAIEQLIRSAGGSIRPSRDLRPRTIEAAREHCGDRAAERKLGGLVLAVMLLVLISPPAMQWVETLRACVDSPTAEEMEQLATEYSQRREIGSHFGLSEAFSQLRRFQADRIGQSLRELR